MLAALPRREAITLPLRGEEAASSDMMIVTTKPSQRTSSMSYAGFMEEHVIHNIVPLDKKLSDQPFKPYPIRSVVTGLCLIFFLSVLARFFLGRA